MGHTNEFSISYHPDHFNVLLSTKNKLKQSILSDLWGAQFQVGLMAIPLEPKKNRRNRNVLAVPSIPPAGNQVMAKRTNAE